MNEFCGCGSYRTGALSAAIYTLILSLLTIAGSAFLMVESKNVGSDIGEVLEIIYGIVLGISAVWLIVSVVAFFFQKNENRKLLLPWIIWTIVLTVLYILGIINNLRTISATFSNGPMAAGFILSIVITIFNIFFLRVVTVIYGRLSNSDGWDTPLTTRA